MAALAARSWSEVEICDLILCEVSQGNTMQRLTEMSQGLVDSTHAGFADTMHTFEMQAGQLTVQERLVKEARDEVPRMSDEITSILADCRSFVLETRAETEATRTTTETAQTTMGVQVQELHDRQQAIATRVVQVTRWLATSEIAGVTEKIAQIEVSLLDLEFHSERCFDEIGSALTAAQSTAAATASEELARQVS